MIRFDKVTKHLGGRKILDAVDMENNRIAYGTSWLLDGAFSSDRPIKAHREV